MSSTLQPVLHLDKVRSVLCDLIGERKREWASDGFNSVIFEILDYFGAQRLLDPVMRLLEFYGHYDIVAACCERYNRPHYFSVRRLRSLNIEDLLALKAKPETYFNDSEVISYLSLKLRYSTTYQTRRMTAV